MIERRGAWKAHDVDELFAEYPSRVRELIHALRNADIVGPRALPSLEFGGEGALVPPEFGDELIGFLRPSSADSIRGSSAELIIVDEDDGIPRS